MALWESAGVTNFRDADGTIYAITIGNGLEKVANSHIAYEPAFNGNYATLLLNIGNSPHKFCTLTHVEDDVPRPGLMIARDSGNCCNGLWEQTPTPTFLVSRERASGNGILGVSTVYGIVCF